MHPSTHGILRDLIWWRISFQETFWALPLKSGLYYLLKFGLHHSNFASATQIWSQLLKFDLCCSNLASTALPWLPPLKVWVKPGLCYWNLASATETWPLLLKCDLCFSNLAFATQNWPLLLRSGSYHLNLTSATCIWSWPLNLTLAAHIAQLLQGHQPRMPDYVKLFLRDAKEHKFEINVLLKSIDWCFLYQNFINLRQIVCLWHGFEVTANFSPQNKIPIEIQ